MSILPRRNYRKIHSQSVDLDFVFFIFDIKSRIVGHSATAIAAGRPLLPAAPSAAVLPAMWPAMAAMPPGATSEAHAGKLTHTYTAWATMMHGQSPQPRFSGLWRSLFVPVRNRCCSRLSPRQSHIGGSIAPCHHLEQDGCHSRIAPRVFSVPSLSGCSHCLYSISPPRG